ncbi:hypothetical protein [Enterococcus sp. N342-3-1-2]
MPNRGDSFIVELTRTHVSWGEHRNTNSRGRVAGECYIPIPQKYAIRYRIYNVNNDGNGIGKNEFMATSSDGFYNGIVKVSGNSKSGSIFAKNISESGNLKGFSEWFSTANIKEGSKIKVEWLSETVILFTKI